MKLRKHIKKAFGHGIHREMKSAETWARISPQLFQAGVTRIADITGLDRIGLPVYNAIVPRSLDIISVYSGKGLTPLDAKTSAAMEAVERYAASLPREATVQGNYEELANKWEVIDPYSINLEIQNSYNHDTSLNWIAGYDLLQEQTVLVPLFLAGYFVFGMPGENPCYCLTTTNGLASGNSLEEAIAHALCELIERDAWTLADIVSHRFSRSIGSGTVDDSEGDTRIAKIFQERHPSIDLESLTSVAQDLVQKYLNVGLEPVLKNITSDMRITSVLCTVAENLSPSFSQAHFGLGTHPDANVAVIRALTEVAQSRAVDIQGMREDITLPGQKLNKSMLHVQRTSKLNKASWYHSKSEHQVRFCDLKTYEHDDLMDDLRLMLQRICDAGLERAIVVPLIQSNIQASVVRAIVPGIESWAVDQSKIGHRATKKWNQVSHELISLQNYRRLGKYV